MRVPDSGIGVMTMRQSASRWALLSGSLLCVVLTLSGCGSSGPGGSVNSDDAIGDSPAASPFVGRYWGLYGGDEYGVFTAVVTRKGAVRVVVTSPSVGTFAGTGTVRDRGGIEMQTSGTGIGGPFTITWTGKLRLSDHTGSGQWVSTSGYTGIWRVRPLAAAACAGSGTWTTRLGTTPQSYTYTAAYTVLASDPSNFYHFTIMYFDGPLTTLPCEAVIVVLDAPAKGTKPVYAMSHMRTRPPGEWFVNSPGAPPLITFTAASGVVGGKLSGSAAGKLYRVSDGKPLSLTNVTFANVTIVDQAQCPTGP
jgi:hypothetical protein